MALMAWSAEYVLGVDRIDEDHERLVQMINELHDATVQGRDDVVARDVLERLVAYTSTHFANEERLMEGHQYPYFRAHKREHEALITEVAEQRAIIERGEWMATVGLATFLRRWLYTHIMHTDRKLALYLNERGVH